MPQAQQELGLPLQESPSEGPDEAKTESFLTSLVEPHFGHWVPSQLTERTRISLSVSHFWQ